MNFVSLFVGRLKHNFGRDTVFRTSLTGPEVERCHAAACTELGIQCWTDMCDCSFDLRPEEGEALRKVPALAEFIFPSDFGGAKYPWSLDDIEWADVYMEVAAHGAKLLGLDLKWSRLDAHKINAGCEAAGYVQ